MFQHLDKNQNKGSLSLIIPITAGLAIIIGGILIWQFEPIILSPIPTKVSENKTANWNIYKSEELGIEFKYPKEWEKLAQMKTKDLLFLTHLLCKKWGNVSIIMDNQ